MRSNTALKWMQISRRRTQRSWAGEEGLSHPSTPLPYDKQDEISEK